MPEAVMTDPPPFAPLARGAVSSNEEASVPREPMHTSAAHIRTPPRAACPRAPEQAGARRRPRPARAARGRRAGRRPLHPVRVHHHRPRLGSRRRHVAVGRLRVRQARLGVQGHPQALLHRHRVHDRRRLGRPRQPPERTQRREAHVRQATTQCRARAPPPRSPAAPRPRSRTPASATRSRQDPCARRTPARRPSPPPPARSSSSPRPTSATTAPTAARSAWCTAAAGS